MASASRHLMRHHILRMSLVTRSRQHRIVLSLNASNASRDTVAQSGQTLTFSRPHCGLAQGYRVGISDVFCEKNNIQTHAFSTTSINEKGKDKGNKKDKKKAAKGAAAKIDIFKTVSRDTMSEYVEYEEMRDKMAHVVDHLKQQLLEKISLRSNPAAYDNIPVNTPDGRFKLMELGQIVQKSPNAIAINLDAAPQYIGEVKKALIESGMNVNAQQEGTTLFIPLPKVTKEHREGLAKNAKALFSKNKESLQSIEKKYTKQLKTKAGISKDEIRNVTDVIVNTTKSYVHEMDQLVDKKIKELLGS